MITDCMKLALCIVILTGCVSGNLAVRSNGIHPSADIVCIMNMDGDKVNEIDVILNRLVLENGFGSYIYLGMQNRPRFCRYVVTYNIDKRYYLRHHPLQYAKFWLYNGNVVIGIGEYKNNGHYFFNTHPSTEQRLRPVVNMLIQGY